MAGPLWLRVVLRAERVVGSRVEAAVRSDTYFDLVAELTRTKALLTGSVEGVSKRIWHLANLPAGTDVRRVREQLARMERRVVELSKELDEQREALQAER
jgi:predicted thioesterase